MELAVNLKQVNYGKALIRIFVLLIVKPFTLPLQIFCNSLSNLISADDDLSDDNVLAGSFPLYVWIISIYDALIVLSYPIGIIAAIRGLFTGYQFTDGFMMFLGILVGAYFVPLALGIVRELSSITLKILVYLKVIVDK